MKTLFAKKKFLLHIFLCSFALIPINRSTSILRKFKKKAISKFKKNAITISSMKNLNFFSTNSSLQFITIYLYYIYVIICFFRFSLETFGYSARIKSLFKQKLFLKSSIKSSMCVVRQTSSYKHGPLFRFSAKKILQSLFFRCVFRCAVK